MKKALNILITFVLILFIGGGLYVFEVFPFNPGGPIIPKKQGVPRGTQQELQTSSQKKELLVQKHTPNT